jgi:UDP-glucose 4-epimerase
MNTLPKKCIVTGGCGFIGSHVVDSLVAAGHEVTVIDNFSTGKRENLNPSASLIEANVEDSGTWDLARADYVFHLAALARIQPSMDNPLPAHLTNVDGTLRALEYCRKVGAKLIFSGSSSIYKGEKVPTAENDEKEIKNPYTLQKLTCEQYIRLYKKLYGLEYAILRYFNVFGERQILEGDYAALVGIFLQQKELGQSLTITNDGEQRRDFTYVKDVAQANLLATEWQGTYNIGTGKNYSVKEIAAMVGGVWKFIGKREGEARVTLADNVKALKKGWKPTVEIKEWICSQV